MTTDLHRRQNGREDALEITVITAEIKGRPIKAPVLVDRVASNLISKGKRKPFTSFMENVMTVSRKSKIALLTTTLLVGALALPTLAQNAPGGTDNGGTAQGGGGGGGGGGRGSFNPQQFQQRMMDRIKTALGSSDDEFTALQPKIEKVMQLSRDANPGMGGMMRRGGRGGGGGAAAPGGGEQATSDVQTKLKDLQTALDNKDTSADDIKTKLQALRDARTAAKADLSKAQDDLKGVLTQRQEAVLVTMGLLE
jgi:Spy/CpxP family protein refolding chaperone